MAITASYTINLALSVDQVLNLAFTSAANAEGRDCVRAWSA